MRLESLAEQSDRVHLLRVFRNDGGSSNRRRTRCSGTCPSAADPPPRSVLLSLKSSIQYVRIYKSTRQREDLRFDQPFARRGDSRDHPRLTPWTPSSAPGPPLPCVGPEGGPAGAVAALVLARRGMHVVVPEFRSAPAPKVGECLPPVQPSAPAP